MENKKEELRRVVVGRLPEPAVTIGYTENQLDLVGKLVADLISLADPAKVTPEIQGRLDALNGLLAHSSVDFDGLAAGHPMEAGKLQKATDLKAYTRPQQERYFLELQKRGLL